MQVDLYNGHRMVIAVLLLYSVVTDGFTASRYAALLLLLWFVINRINWP